MIVILDGCDKTGKSSLAMVLAKKLGLQYYHAGVSSEEDLYSKYKALIASIKEPTVADRFYLSELVYGPVLRGHSRLTAEQFRELNKEVGVRKGVFIHCYADPGVLVKRFEQDGESLTRVVSILDILEGYKRVARIAAEVMPVLRYDSGRSSEETGAQIESLVGFLASIPRH